MTEIRVVCDAHPGQPQTICTFLKTTSPAPGNPPVVGAELMPVEVGQSAWYWLEGPPPKRLRDKAPKRFHAAGLPMAHEEYDRGGHWLPSMVEVLNDEVVAVPSRVLVVLRDGDGVDTGERGYVYVWERWDESDPSRAFEPAGGVRFAVLACPTALCRARTSLKVDRLVSVLESVAAARVTRLPLSRLWHVLE